MEEIEWLAGRFEQHRPRLRAVAYRMLGSVAEADDAVQDAWLRLCRSDADEIDNLGGWLTTVVARECLHMLRSRRRREESRLPEPVVVLDSDLDPEQEAVEWDGEVGGDSVGATTFPSTMEDTVGPRIPDANTHLPEIQQLAGALVKATANGSVPATTSSLVYLRAGQLVGSTYQVMRHSVDLRKAGESEARIAAVATWRDAPCFTDAEQAALMVVLASAGFWMNVALINKPEPVPA